VNERGKVLCELRRIVPRACGLRLFCAGCRFLQRQPVPRGQPLRGGECIFAFAWKRAFLGQLEQIVEAYPLVRCQLLANRSSPALS